MKKITAQGIEAIAVRRASIADADKVRYRVYRTPSDFIAVIAENALMAVKVSGIADPYRIMRDFPTQGITIQSERMAKQEVYERITLATAVKTKSVDLVMPRPAEMKADGFIPMQLRDLENKTTRHSRIMSPQAMEAMMLAAMQRAQPSAMPVAQTSPTMSDSVADHVADRVAEDIPAPHASAPAEPTPTSSPIDPESITDEVLSPQQVSSLLQPVHDTTTQV